MAIGKKMDCVILGLLSHESMTGYEIKKRMDTSLKFFWGASYGSIYPTLNGLVLDELVTKLETKENGRDKVTYTITEQGREHLRNWLHLPVEKDELRYETLLKLFFGSEIGKDGTLEHITNFEEKIRKELPVLERAVNVLEKIKDTDETHLYYLLTATFGVKVYGAYLEWCDEAKKIL
jgi:DNA-binding PadR family transcriptional regulator